MRSTLCAVIASDSRSLARDVRGEPTLFLYGHPLGLMPLEARKLVTEELDDWSRLAVLGHEQVIRVAPVPLYNTFEEVFGFSEHLSAVLREIP